MLLNNFFSHRPSGSFSHGPSGSGHSSQDYNRTLHLKPIFEQRYSAQLQLSSLTTPPEAWCHVRNCYAALGGPLDTWQLFCTPDINNELQKKSRISACSKRSSLRKILLGTTILLGAQINNLHGYLCSESGRASAPTL